MPVTSNMPLKGLESEVNGNLESLVRRTSIRGTSATPFATAGGREAHGK